MSEEKAEQEKGERGPKTAEALERERKKNEELTSTLRYLEADFENYRKRVDKEMASVKEASIRNLVLKLLSAVDELSLAIENARRDGNLELLEGIKMVRKNLVASLEAEGMERIPAAGEAFDPRLHEAVEKVKGSSDRDLVVREIRPGYKLRGQVIRPSMVKVELAKGREAKGVEDSE